MELRCGVVGLGAGAADARAQSIGPVADCGGRWPKLSTIPEDVQTAGAQVVLV